MWYLYAVCGAQGRGVWSVQYCVGVMCVMYVRCVAQVKWYNYIWWCMCCVYGRHVPYMWYIMWYVVYVICICNMLCRGLLCGSCAVCFYGSFACVTCVWGMYGVYCGMWYVAHVGCSRRFTTGAEPHPLTLPIIILVSIPTWTWWSLDPETSLCAQFKTAHLIGPGVKMIELKICRHTYWSSGLPELSERCGGLGQTPDCSWELPSCWGPAHNSFLPSFFLTPVSSSLLVALKPQLGLYRSSSFIPVLSPLYFV